jgi:Family of unknown function (DUF5947)
MTDGYEKTDPGSPQSAIAAPAVRSPQSVIRNQEGQGQSAFAVLRKFVRARAPAERCEMCSLALGAEHQHLVEPQSRQIVCSCEACAILFSNQVETKYKRVPRRVRYLADFRLSDAQWDSLAIPIQLAFFFHSTPEGRTLALYPSPAGPTESLLPLDSWGEIVEDNPVLRKLEPDTEALLANRVRGASEYYIAPIDECYKLVGLIRAHWRGLSGGTEVWREIGSFFEGLNERAGVTGENPRRA